MKIKTIRNLLPLIGIALFIYILLKIDLNKVIEEIAGANLFLLFLSLILIFPILVLQTFKWFVIAKKQKINVSFMEAFKINFVCNFYGFVTPSKVGTIIRADYLRKYTKNMGKGVSNFVLDKVLDIASVFFLAIVFSFIFQEFSFLPRFYFLVIFLALVILTFIFIKKERSRFLLSAVYRKLIPKKMKSKVRMTFNSFYEDMPKKRYFIWFFFLNIVNWLVLYSVNFLAGKAVGINIGFIYFLAILPIVTLVSLIPITINGLGTSQAASIVLFGLFNVGAEKVFSMSLLFLFISGVLPAIIGGFLSLKNKN